MPVLTGAPRAALANPAPAAHAARQVLDGATRELGTYRRAAQVVSRRMASRRAAEEAAAAAAAAVARQAAEEAAAREEAAREAARQAARAAAPAPTLTTAAPTPAPAPRPAPTLALVPGADAAAEAHFLTLLNQVRGQNGLGPLAVDGRLRSGAQGWASQLSQDGALHHQDMGRFLDQWTVAGENVAFGPSVDAMFRALVASPRHYANMVKAEFSVVGIGVVPAADGTLWTSHVFAG